MPNRNNWFQALVQTVGIPELLAIILGVPAMIVGISKVWSSLSQVDQIIVGICVGLVILAIGLFVYGQTRKILYIIPNILYKMHCRARELSSSLDALKLEIKDISLFLSLFEIDSDKFFSDKNISEMSGKGDEVIQEVTQEAIELFQIQAQKKMELDKDVPTRASRYMGEQIGLRQVLKSDKKYQRLVSKLGNIRPLMRTEEMSRATNEYVNNSEAINNIRPFLKVLNSEELSKILPLKTKVNGLGMEDMAEEGMSNLLSKVWESIDSYYKKG